jgi:phage minor structural protein
MAMRLFNADETNFTSNGEKYIQPIFAHEIRNRTEWYLDVRVPLSFVEYIANDKILVVETKEKGKQPFRIRDIEIENDIRFEAWHVGYDTRNYTVSLSTFINVNCQSAITTILSDTQSNNYVAYSDISSLQTFSIIDSTLYSGLTEIASRYGGYLDFDGWEIRIVSSIGTDKGVTIAYGKNLEGASVQERWDKVVTELKPIGNDGLVGTTLISSIDYGRPYAKIVNFDTDDLTTLNNLAGAYLSRFETPQLYYNVASSLINADLGDTIQVKAKQFNVLTEVIGYKYNIQTKRMINIEFGNFRPTVKNAFGQLREEFITQADRNAQIKIDEVNGEIDLRVRKDEVISSINLSPETIKIEAPNIALEGIITANGNIKILEDGSIEATNGKFNGEITAETGSIGRFDISADDLVYTSELFEYQYDRSDLVQLLRIFAGSITETPYHLAIYDFNNSGVLTITDYVILQGHIDNGTALPTPRKKVRSVITIGTDNGTLKTTSVAENGSVGPSTIINGDSVDTNSLTLGGIAVAGYIEKFGSAAGQHWVAYTDGTLIKYGDFDRTVAVATSFGNLWNNAQQNVVFNTEVPFIDRPILQVDSIDSTNNNRGTWCVTLNSSITDFDYQMYSPVSRSSQTWRIGWKAIGRWK